MSYLAAGGLLAFHKPAPSNLTPPAASGPHEEEILGLAPAVYLKFAETSGTSFADSSGNGRNAALNGTGAALAATALAANVGSGNTAVDLGNAAWISIPHAAADTALTVPSNWESEQSTDGYRFIADATASLWFNPNSLPTGTDVGVLIGKSSATTPAYAGGADATGTSYVETHPMEASPGATVNGGSLEAYLDANGAVHVEVRSFRGRPCRLRTLDGAVSAGTTYHLVVQLSYDGVTAWLDGAKFEDGYANLLHVFGLCTNIRNVVFRNNYDWTIGKAAWGGQADLIVDEFAIYLRAPSATISQSNVNTLAQVGSTPTALAHHVWGLQAVNENAFSGTAGTTERIQNAIANVTASGGGTVLINPGTYTGNIILANNVRLKANGGTVQINGRCRTPTITPTTLTDNGGNFLTGDRNLDVSNTRVVGDIVFTRGTAGNPSPMRHDRRWNSASGSNDPAVPDAEAFEIESRAAGNMTFVGIGTSYDFASADRAIVQAFTPTSWVALEGDLRFTSASGNGIDQFVVEFNHSKHVRVVGITTTNTASVGQAIMFGNYTLYAQGRDCTVNQSTALTQEDNDGCNVYRVSKDCIYKDCLTTNGRHAADVAANLVTGPVLRAEFHNLRWETIWTSASKANGATAAIGTHGMCTDTIYWNFVSDFGGPNITGWMLDARWMVTGEGAGSGAFAMEDGLGDSYIRDCFIINPNNATWFVNFEATVNAARCHFRNITWSAVPTGTQHVRITYSTGADVNTYNNVDGAHANWQEV